MRPRELLEAGRQVGIAPAEVAALCILLAGSLALTGVVWWSGRPATTTVEGSGALGPAVATAPTGPADLLPGEPSEAATAAAEVVVDVAGEVTRPGLVRLEEGSRVADAIQAAGGVLPGAGTEGLNLARVLVDGEQVVVGGAAPAVGAHPAAPSAVRPDGLLDLNRATAEELQELPGVGPVTAERIIDHREKIGTFSDVVQLLEVPGIGPARLASLQDLVAV